MTGLYTGLKTMKGQGGNEILYCIFGQMNNILHQEMYNITKYKKILQTGKIGVILYLYIERGVTVRQA